MALYILPFAGQAMAYIKGKFIRENVSSLKPISIFIVIGHWEGIV